MYALICMYIVCECECECVAVVNYKLVASFLVVLVFVFLLLVLRAFTSNYVYTFSYTRIIEQKQHKVNSLMNNLEFIMNFISRKSAQNL